ncbi:hypothetical protein FNV43_RR05397 [Rhamnella rubrinervis]|uniref:Uncharacterized protein n=1 Tax=Rhamnella rubrinervis TaxID=2594499 RepID=A0A8K0HNW9_9ROSA|nr:hypothetical protein FNV43_RR05397 [Rhamnella rubrinervis]
MSGAIIPALMHQIPLELRSYVCLGESSTRMGDLLGSPLIAEAVQQRQKTPNAALRGCSQCLKVVVAREQVGCDHTCTNAPDPIITPKLSVP